MEVENKIPNGPNDLVTAVTGQQTNTPPPSGGDKPAGGEPADDIWKQIETSTGGRIKSMEDLSTLPKTFEQLSAFEAKIAELESSKPQGPEFANDWMKQLNDLVAGGAEFGDVDSFIRLSMQDVNNMQPLEAIAQQWMMEYGMPRDQVDALLVEQYGIDTEEGGKTLDNLTPAKLAMIAKDGKMAKDALNERRAEFAKVSAPQTQQSDEDAKMQQAKALGAVNFWAPTLQNIPAEIDFKVEAGEKDGDFDYGLNFKPKPEVIKQAKDIVLGEIKSNPDQYPQNEQGQAAIVELYNNMLWALAGKDIARAIVHDATASAREWANRKHSGKVPSTSGSDGKVQPAGNAPQRSGPPPISELLNQRR